MIQIDSFLAFAAACSFAFATSGLSGHMMFFHLTSWRFLLVHMSSVCALSSPSERDVPVVENDRNGLLGRQAPDVRDLEDSSTRANLDSAGRWHQIDASLEFGGLASVLKLLKGLHSESS